MSSTSKENESALTAERVRELFDCDPATGVLTWRLSRGRVRAGAVAGTIDARGYCHVKIGDYSYLRHRLVWLHASGEWPPGDLDHEDNCPGHDWIDNLRPATQSQNCANMRRHRDNVSGFKGVYFLQGRWVARIMRGRRAIHIGRFRSPEEAHAAYIANAKEIFGEFANEGG